MWIVSKEDKYVASTWGASINLQANQPRQVGHDMGLLCLQAGCIEVQESEVPAMAPAPVKEPVVEEVIEEIAEEVIEPVEEISIDLEAMTKVQLEEHGRTMGIELDRRKKKSALIEELKAAESSICQHMNKDHGEALDLYAQQLLKRRGTGWRMVGIDSDGADLERDGWFARLNFLNQFDYSSNIGIGHTRWATHGAKTDSNSHPHISHDGKFSLVHNGIIENFQEIKQFLLENDIENISQTDTEVIVNLVSYYYNEDKNISNAIEKATQRLTGTWGIAIICIDEPNTIYCTRHGSPLLIGIDDKMAMITSEQSGFCNQFSKYIVLNNQDICSICFNNDKITIDTKDL